jgi:xanthine dehydrogenase YagT iron-sulfur-binding subunit
LQEGRRPHRARHEIIINLNPGIVPEEVSMEEDKDKEKQEKEEEQGQSGMTRRSFLGSVSAGAVGVAASASLLSGQKAQAHEEVMKANELYRVTLFVNGKKHTLLVEPRWSLQYVLRGVLGMTATKEGCARGECGACTVLINDLPRLSCQTLALEVDGAKITTLEGLMKGDSLGPVQEAFIKEDGLQCGYCTAGQIMSAEGLLRANPDPTPEEITHAMSGNICRCGAYPNIFRAVKLAAQMRK